MIGEYLIEAMERPTRGAVYPKATQRTPRLKVWIVFGFIVEPGIVQVI